MIKEFNFTKREFMQELFLEYNKLPFAKCLKNFASVFNDIFLDEIPIGKIKYQLQELQIIELANMNSPFETFEMPFKHNFMTQTSHYVDYTNSEFFIEVIKQICRRVKQVDNVLRVNLQKRANSEDDLKGGNSKMNMHKKKLRD